MDFTGMPTYHFTLRKCQPLEYRGAPREYRDLEAALADAQGTARNLLGQYLRKIDMHMVRGILDIEDERNRPVARIMLADLVSRAS
jgi:hypothetical protein